MTNVKSVYTVDLPTWALSWLCNADRSALDEDDYELVTTWEKGLVEPEDVSHYSLQISNEEPYFDPHPEFGLACDCQSVKVWIFEKEAGDD